MNIALYLRSISPSLQPLLNSLVSSLEANGATTRFINDGDNVDGFDCMLTIGGDGTLLASVQFVHASSPEALPPILGVNFGHLGFLTSVGRDSVDILVADLLAGRYTTEKRTLLSLSTELSSQTPPYALNEMFVHRTDSSSVIRTQVFVDDMFVATYAGDGVIVATPTGSTAYSLSCGGPILTPDSGCFVITPIGAHTLTLRPIIVPDTVHLRLECDPDNRFTLGVDSHRFMLDGGTSLTLCKAPFTVRLIRMNNQSFFSAIRSKLMWGSEVRNGE
ncbi:MAG: NAD(+)/NADH kinase [Bacteroidales bacterium]|nr:NAD(+)/NADH kinase [Bacteroidales bacterium]